MRFNITVQQMQIELNRLTFELQKAEAEIAKLDSSQERLIRDIKTETTRKLTTFVKSQKDLGQKINQIRQDIKKTEVEKLRKNFR